MADVLHLPQSTIQSEPIENSLRIDLCILCSGVIYHCNVEHHGWWFLYDCMSTHKCHAEILTWANRRFEWTFSQVCDRFLALFKISKVLLNYIFNRQDSQIKLNALCTSLRNELIDCLNYHNRILRWATVQKYNIRVLSRHTSCCCRCCFVSIFFEHLVI